MPGFVGHCGKPAASFSIRLPPNGTCEFPGIPLSSSRILRRLALGISPTSFPTAPVHLPPFALWPAFPASDYDGGSVAIGLAPGRRSRVFLVLYVRAWFRPSIHPYSRRIFAGIPPHELA